jgi:hypothetical protein
LDSGEGTAFAKEKDGSHPLTGELIHGRKSAGISPEKIAGKGRNLE